MKTTWLACYPLRKVLVSDPNLTVSEIMITDFEAIPVSMPDNEVAQLFERMDWGFSARCE